MNIPTQFSFPLLLLLIWILAWKGYALWVAGRRGEPYWFIALLLLNTLGILEIFYIFYRKTPVVVKSGAVVFDDFQKLDLRVGKILSAEKVPGSAKLVKLEVDLGDKKRQIIAGIGAAYGTEDLTERDIVVIVNLEPRKLMGLESQGMLLAADAEGPVLLMPDKTVPPGSKIR